MGDIRPGQILTGCTDGRWSTTEAIRAMLAKTGTPANVSITTWRVGPADAEHLVILRRAGLIGRLRLVLDRSVHGLDRTDLRRGAKPIFHRVAAVVGVENLRVWNGHAKIVVVAGPDMLITHLPSANLNRAQRAETYVTFGEPVAESPVHDLYAGIFRDLFAEELPVEFTRDTPSLNRGTAALTNRVLGNPLAQRDQSEPEHRSAWLS
ncbi:hypothetical protein [Candidatus Palauibacter sp.]|uniref:hypothetical protein n=1 Tax=Candidatus Palauibacter sp. TaxID=3101350 RepID=UPI003B01E1ED